MNQRQTIRPVLRKRFGACVFAIASLSTALLLSAAAAHALPGPVPAPVTAAVAAQQDSRLHVTDDTGRAVDVPQPVRRIVSLAPSLTETLFALGAGQRVVGDTDFCDYPAEARSKPHVGGVQNPSIEAIAALHPDLVVVTAVNRYETMHSLERLHIPVYATDPHNVDQVLSSTARLGELVGVGKNGDALVADLRRRLSQLTARLAGVAPANVFFVVWQDPPISVGRNTFLADALVHAGARSVIDAPQDWPNINLEEVVRLQPAYLVYASDDAAQVRRQIGELGARAGWRDLDAVRKNRIVIVAEAIDHPSPRLVDAIEQLARALHADRFGGASAATGGA